MQTCITGTGMTRFGRHEEADVVDLAVEAAQEAMTDAGVGPEDIDCLYLGNFLGQSLLHQGVLASIVAQRLGLPPVPVATVEGACASAGIALRSASLAVRAGEARVALALGAEHLTGVPVAETTGGLAEAMVQGTDGASGLTFPGLFALAADAYLDTFGYARDDLAAVPVMNRAHGVHNPLAMFGRAVDAQTVLSSRLIADPLRLFDCSPISDGAAAAVVAAGPTGGSQAPVVIRAAAQAYGPPSIAQIPDLTTFSATRAAARRAFEVAGLTPGDVDVVELHDCFSVAQVIDAEDLGLTEAGKALREMGEGRYTHGGAGPLLNPSGGLLSRGHPVGATGLAQVHEIVQQLRGRSTNQAPDARIGLAHNLGGAGATATVTILEATS